MDLRKGPGSWEAGVVMTYKLLKGGDDG